jgi:type IV pilus assembly protein PilM
MWSNTVTLYVDDTSVRMLVLDGQRVKKWAQTDLEPGLIKGGVVTVEGEVGNKIKQLLQENDVRAKWVILGFSGIHSLTRPASLPILPRNMLPEAVAREARRVLPVPLDQLYLSWRLAPSPKGKIHIFMAATPRKAADSLVKTLRIAGLTVRQMAIKPLALTKLVPENTAILIDVQPDEFDIVILNNGVPQPIRTVTFPNTELNWDKKLEMITSDVNRTIKFFDTNNPEKPLTAEVSVYASGELMSQPELLQNLGTVLGRAVVPLQPTLKGPEQIDLSRYLVNVALSVKSAPMLREPSFAVASLNMLPAPYQPKPISTTKLIGIPCGVAVVGVLVPMVLMMQDASANILALQSQVDKMNEITAQKTEEKTMLTKNIADLQKQSDATKTAYENLKLSLDKLTSSQEIVNGDLQLVLNLKPEAVEISSITQADGGLSIQGKAPTQAEVLAYARDLDLSNRFVQTTVASVQETVSPDTNSLIDVQFSLIMQRKG